MDSESSSEDEAPSTARKHRNLTFSMLRGDKNLAEPRTSQGVFSINGTPPSAHLFIAYSLPPIVGGLVCFFRAPPRIVRNPMREMSVSPSVASQLA